MIYDNTKFVKKNFIGIEEIKKRVHSNLHLFFYLFYP